MKAIYDLPAPAKLNLFLHVVGRRPDGMHLLQSVFMLIDWCDTLHVEARADGKLSREDLGTPLPNDDLVLQAAKALQQAAGVTAGAHIGVLKRIPAEAGMGGGSSDAATCLLALNRLWGLHWPLSKLEQIGLLLGADVPFFLRGRNAFVEGVGEKIRPIALTPASFVVAKPQAGVATRSIFADASLVHSTAPAIIAGFAADESAPSTGDENRSCRPWDAPWAFGQNDLQPVAQRLFPGITEAIDWLGTKGLVARMTGSGSAVFAAASDKLCVDLSDAPRGWQVRLCSNLAVHPLAGWADNTVSVG